MHEDTRSSTDTRPTIFLIEEDNHAHRPLKRNLRRLGYRVLAVLDLEDALEWVSVARIPADLILINLVGKSVEETLEMGRTLRERANDDSPTPLVVMPEKVDKELEGRDVNVDGNDWISYYEDGDQLRRLLERLLPRVPST